MLDIVLYQPEIPNTGNIIRLCANTGYRLHLIEPWGSSGMTSGSSGPGSTITSLPTSSAGLTMRRFWRPSPPTGLCLHHQGTHRPLGGPVCPGDALLFGPESRGLPMEIIESLPFEQRLRIPMLPQSRSMNLANAVAVFVYESWRQFDYSGSL